MNYSEYLQTLHGYDVNVFVDQVCVSAEDEECIIAISGEAKVFEDFLTVGGNAIKFSDIKLIQKENSSDKDANRWFEKSVRDLLN